MTSRRSRRAVTGLSRTEALDYYYYYHYYHYYYYYYHHYYYYYYYYYYYSLDIKEVT